MPPKFQPNLYAQAQMFQIFLKKLSMGVRSPCFPFLIESKTEKYISLIVPYITFLQLLPDVGFSCLGTSIVKELQPT